MTPMFRPLHRMTYGSATSPLISALVACMQDNLRPKQSVFLAERKPGRPCGVLRVVVVGDSLARP